MNPRQRRGLLLLAAAGLAAAAVFLMVLSYVGRVRQEVGPLGPALRLRVDVAAHQAVLPSMVEAVQVPVRWRPRTALQAPEDLRGQVAAGDLPQGSWLQAGMLQPPPGLAPGQRELTVSAGGAARLAPGDLVDVYASFAAGASGRAVTRVVVSGARVLGVGGVAPARQAGGATDAGTLPVTFALSPADSLAVTYAEAFAQKLDLALLRPGDAPHADARGRSYGAADLARSPAGGGQ